MAIMRNNSSRKANNIFFLHPTKCGGSAVSVALQETKLKILKTHSLKPDIQSLRLLQNSSDLVVHGHVEYIQQPGSRDEYKIFEEIIRILYQDFDLIVPVRNPANLVQSWMHYCKTRSNDALRRINEGGKTFVSSKEISFMKRMSCLRQNALIFNNSSGYFLRGKSFPCITLLEEDEAENLFLFMNNLKNSADGLPMLLPMQRQLFFPLWKSLAQKYVIGEPYTLKLPVSSGSRFVHYYSCEGIGEKAKAIFNNIFGMQFVRNLESVRVNVSEKKPKVQASQIPQIVELSKRIAKSEWLIYENVPTFEPFKARD